MTGTPRRVWTDRPSWAILARLWPLWAVTVLAAAALVEIGWQSYRVYRRRRFQAWLRQQMAEVNAW